jgi:hypothetical protein
VDLNPRIHLDQILRIEDELLEYEHHLLRLSIFLGLFPFSNFFNKFFQKVWMPPFPLERSQLKEISFVQKSWMNLWWSSRMEGTQYRFNTRFSLLNIFRNLWSRPLFRTIPSFRWKKILDWSLAPMVLGEDFFHTACVNFHRRKSIYLKQVGDLLCWPNDFWRLDCWSIWLMLAAGFHVKEQLLVWLIESLQELQALKQFQTLCLPLPLIWLKLEDNLILFIFYYCRSRGWWRNVPKDPFVWLMNLGKELLLLMVPLRDHLLLTLERNVTSGGIDSTFCSESNKNTARDAFLWGSATDMQPLNILQILHPEVINLEATTNITAFKMDVHLDRWCCPWSPITHLSLFSPANVTPTEGAYFDDSIPVPLYKLRLGVNRHSGGINCAETCGLSSSIVHRANEIATTLSCHSVIEPLKKYQTQQMNKILAKKDLLKLFFSVENWEESTESEIEQIRHLLGVGEKR